MAIPGQWKGQHGLEALCHVLSLDVETWHEAERQARYNYQEHPRFDKRTGKRRDLCYPPKDSILRRVQCAIKDRILSHIDVIPEICGYRKGMHNIRVAAEVSGFKFNSILDISRFHPSTSIKHVAVALHKHGLSWGWARRLAPVLTYRGRLPQGAVTSNHVANIVLDGLMRRAIIPFATARKVIVRNYGDDIALAGDDPKAVRACFKEARRVIAKAGFEVSAKKCRELEHEGGKRHFIGCATGRCRPDYPRAKFRQDRDELRGILHKQSMSPDAEPLAAKQIDSLKQRIAYVARLNRRKARGLKEYFYRICAKNRKQLAAAGRGHRTGEAETLESGTGH